MINKIYQLIANEGPCIGRDTVSHLFTKTVVKDTSLIQGHGRTQEIPCREEAWYIKSFDHKYRRANLRHEEGKIYAGRQFLP
jgi:hypothetical protein